MSGNDNGDAEAIRDAIARLDRLYRGLDDRWAARRERQPREAYSALGVALTYMDDAREALERAVAALTGGEG